MDYTYYLIWGAGKPFQRCLRRINTVAVYIKLDMQWKISATKSGSQVSLIIRFYNCPRLARVAN